jgi:hypothetical protein
LNKGETGPCALLAAIAATWQADPSRAPPPDSPMWLALASIAVGVRTAAVAPVDQSSEGDNLEEMKHLRCFSALLPLLQLAVVAAQQPGAGWGALVLGSAVQGAALACCASAVTAAWEVTEDLTTGAVRLQMHRAREEQMAEPQQTVRSVRYRAMCLGVVCDMLFGIEYPAAAAAAAGVTAAAAPAAAGGGTAPHQAREARLTTCVWLLKVLDLLRSLSSSWPAKPAVTRMPADPRRPDPKQAAAGAWARVASLPADSTDAEVVDARSTLLVLACVMDVCDVATSCARACGGATPQLLGCAHLGCTSPPPGGLASCEASLGVNRKGGVCGGCGVVRYCSAACAQQDWPGHRRVCRRLAAAAAAKQQGAGQGSCPVVGEQRC